METGLKTSPLDNEGTDNWDMHDKYMRDFGCHPVFLAKDPDEAYEFAEVADHVSNELYDSGIVVLEVNVAYLDPHLLMVDTFYNDFEDHGINGIYDVDNERCRTVVYTEDIPPEAIRIL